jgi:ligand-binding sensor protein
MLIDTDVNRLRAINEAIWLRDHSSSLDIEHLLKVVAEIGGYKIFSARQIQSMTGNILSRQKISQLCRKSDKTGGNLQVADLEKIRDLFYGKSNGIVNYKLVKEVVENGTSQGMLNKLTGINQSSISKMIKERS